MRWNVEPLPKIGDRRIKRQFLLAPLIIGDEARWMERAAWVQVYTEMGLLYAEWHNERWCE